MLWGCGPVGQFAIWSAWKLEAGRVIAIDNVPERLQLAEKKGKSETINFEKNDVYETLMQMTAGKGPDCCIDAVGAEAHAHGSMDAMMDKLKTGLHLTNSRAHVLREAIKCCRKGGVLSVPGVYVGRLDNMPFGAFMNKALTLKTGQTHVQRYQKLLLKYIENKEVDPSFIITHRIKIDEAPHAYRIFRDKKEDCIKVVIDLSRK